jgi:hypothetical protein
MKTHKETSSKALFDALIKLHETPNISSVFYLFQQLFSSAWDGTSAVSEHISTLRTVESRLAGMKYSVDDKVLSFILLNSLPNTPAWEMFKSSVVNTVEESKLTFDSIETRITSEDSQLHPSGHSESAMKASRAGSFKPTARPSNATAWCEHHLSTTHNSSNCNTYKKWVSELRKGGFRKLEKGKDKANAVEGTPDPPDSANIANEHVSHSESAMQRIHAYLSSQSEDSGRNTLIIDSGASSHIVPHRSWFRTYRPLQPPRLVTLGDNSNTMAIGIGTVPIISKASGTTYEIVLSNVLLIPEFRISLSSVNRLASAGLSTAFPADSDMCYVWKDRNTILVAAHKNGLYLARVTPDNQKEAALATVDINLLHRRLGHISTNRIQQMVKSGQLQGIDTLAGTPTFCEACVLGKMKKLPFEVQERPCTTRSLEMVHTDVGGPITPRSREGYRFWIVIVDDFTRFP